MPYTAEQIAEMDILIHYNLDSVHQGIKVHSSADSAVIAAVGRLYDKGLVTQQDGGYLTELGRRAAEHAQALLLMLAEHRLAS
jgi:uncharacterized protein (TIGR02647 family)